MLKRIIMASLLWSLSTMAVSAFEIKQPDTVFNEPFKSQRQACLDQFETAIVSRFDKLTSISLGDPSFFSDIDGTYALVTFAGVTFDSGHGSANGAITCLFLEGGRRLAHVSATFQRPGLMGAARAGFPQQRLLSAGAQVF
ncbi:hypothetical protein [Marivita sp.]|uniref:hypothetical protein n=1 Tax=Marivita sp. TaxID=2003365 RepID=UPI003F6D1CFB